MKRQQVSTGVAVFALVAFVDGFVFQNDLVRSKTRITQSYSLWDGVSSLWEEIIEVSSYGPSERKMLKKQREQQRGMQQEFSKQLNKSTDEEASLLAVDDNNDGQAWLDAFAAAKDKGVENDVDVSDKSIKFDGYDMRDLLVAKWGVPLDLDLQRIGDKIYCTVLPMVGYGSPLKSRHDSEIAYLMHLQGVVEVLHKYNNLELFVGFVETTSKVPKRGTDAVLFPMSLSEAEIDRIVK